MRTLFAVTVLVAALPVFAVENAAGPTNDVKAVKVTPYPASKMNEFNKMTGGLVDPPANAKVLLILDARQEDVPELKRLTEATEELAEVAVDTQKITLDDKACPQKVAFDAKTGKAGAVILIYERDGAPVLSAFPEDGVVLLNVLPLVADNPNRKWRIRRSVTEYWRSIAFALGGYGMPTQLCNSMQPIFSLKDYETLRGAGLQPVQFSQIQSSKWKLGITGRNPVPYSTACREGWAPAPTNDVQRAIYEKTMNPTARFQQDFKQK